MNESNKGATRTYNSPLRAEQMERTRERILEAAAEQLLEEGLEELSLPRAAQRARVSVPTIYRHFPTKAALMQELTDWVDQKLRLSEVPGSVDEFADYVPRLFAHWDENEALVRARLLSGVHRRIHEDTRRQRDKLVEKAMVDVTERLDPFDARRACAVVRVLMNSGAWEMMRDNWNLMGEQAGETLAWAIHILVEELRRNPNSMKEFTKNSGSKEEE
ncbi:MAG: TetR/AcrR family transcriptional regulator [Actinobacteria bacterium]|nr:TetR/AcrR family transcriptional regulator [Actinomycetota bacterium]